MAITRSQRIAQQLREVQQTYAAKHAAAHNEFKANYARLLDEHGLTVSAHADFHDLPAELHEALAPFKEGLAAALAKADGERHSVASVLKPKISYIRAN